MDVIAVNALSQTTIELNIGYKDITMSLFSTVLKPMLEKEIKSLEPQIAFFILTQLKKVAAEAIEWSETKMNVDINNDGKIGESKNEAS
jgi:hypothetical protein